MDNIYHNLLGLSKKEEKPNYYQILGLKEGKPTSEEVEKYYKDQLQKLQGMGNNPKYKDAILFLKGELRKANYTLSDKTRRTEYDILLHTMRVELFYKEISPFRIKGYITEEEFSYLVRRGRQLRLSPTRVVKILSQEKDEQEEFPVEEKNVKKRFSTTSPGQIDPSSESDQADQTDQGQTDQSVVYFVVIGVLFLFNVYFFFRNSTLQEELRDYKEKYYLQSQEYSKMKTSLINMRSLNLERKIQSSSFDISFDPVETPSATSIDENIDENIDKNIDKNIDENIDESLVSKEEVTELEGKFPQKLIYVSAGSFFMGSEEGNPDEFPKREIFLDSYFISPFEVSNREYREFVQEMRYKVPYLSSEEARPFNWDPTTRNYPKGRGDYPVVIVNWRDAVSYCNWLAKKTDSRVTLPSEAQWEKAARGKKSFFYPWGNSKAIEKGRIRANYKGERDGFVELAPVGAFPDGRSPYGCYDMSGNVYEWCLDSYEKYAYQELPKRNPINIKNLEQWAYKVLRGGSWKRNEVFLSVTYRLAQHCDQANIHWGFRYVVLPKER